MIIEVKKEWSKVMLAIRYRIYVNGEQHESWGWRIEALVSAWFLKRRYRKNQHLQISKTIKTIDL